MAKGVEYFIASRTSRSEKRGGGGVMMPVAKIAVGLSIAVMVITLAVILGFKREIESKLTSLSGQLLVSSIEGGGSDMSRAIVASEELEQTISLAAEECGEEVGRIAPYVARGVVVRTEESLEGALLKGVGEGFDRELFLGGLTEGDVPNFEQGSAGRNVLISSVLANKLKLSVGSRLELLTSQHTLSESGDESFTNAMRRDLYRVGGIYTLGLGDAEGRVIFADIDAVRRLNGFSKEEISGYEVWCGGLKCAPQLAQRLNELMLFASGNTADGAAAYAVQSLYPSIFDWLAAHDINAMIVIVIMLVVAIFNITTAMLILVLERTRLIGILKVLGMRSSSIRKIFLYRAMSIAMWGIVCGNGVAIALCLVQREFDVIKLDEEGYLLCSVPISLGWDWLLLLNVGVVAVVAMLVLLPTRIVSRVEPSEAIKFE